MFDFFPTSHLNTGARWPWFQWLSMSTLTLVLFRWPFCFLLFCWQEYCCGNDVSAASVLFILVLFISVVLRIEPRTSHMFGRHSIAELHPWSTVIPWYLLFYCFEVIHSRTYRLLLALCSGAIPSGLGTHIWCPRFELGLATSRSNVLTCLASVYPPSIGTFY